MAGAADTGRDVGITGAPGGGGGDRWAVIVGVDEYESPDITPLRCAAQDARDFAATLESLGGFAPDNVKLLVTGAEGDLKPDAVNVSYWLGVLKRNAKAADTVVFFFSGHGYDGGLGQYLLPADADTRNEATLKRTCLPLSEVRGELDGAAAERVVMFIDACRNAPRRARGAEGSAMSAAFQDALKSRARAVYSACSVGEMSFERTDTRNGVFTHCLLQGLRGAAASADGYVDLLSLKAFVDRGMALWNRDHPDKAMNPWLQVGCSGRVVLTKAPAPAPEPLVTMATLSVTGAPEGCDVYVDGRLRGRVPCELQVDLGVERERVVEVGATKPGCKSAAARVTLVRGRTVGWTVDLQPVYTLIVSHLGHKGPRYEAGMTPEVMGWGPDGQAYPDRFVVNEIDGAEMVWVPAGEFTMGSTKEQIDKLWADNGWEFEKPTDEAAHRERISSAFWLYKHEVTFDQYLEYALAVAMGSDGWSARAMPGDRRPMCPITWYGARLYCRWAGGRLPSEAEWEWAARGPEGRLFPWGDRWDARRCCCAEVLGRQAIADPRRGTRVAGGRHVDQRLRPERPGGPGQPATRPRHAVSEARGELRPRPELVRGDGHGG